MLAKPWKVGGLAARLAAGEVVEGCS